MIPIGQPAPLLSQDILALYYTTDPLLANSPVIVFHGASTTTNSSLSSSRIQIHIYSSAGFQSFPRITVAPTSPLYNVVNYLPHNQQGDEVRRGLAVGLYKHFLDTKEPIRNALAKSAAQDHGRPGGPASALFDEAHAAELVSKMIRIDNMCGVIRDLNTALSQKGISVIDVDVVLPPGSIAKDLVRLPDGVGDPLEAYGHYASLIGLLGVPAFLPTSKLRRAPSKPSSLNRSKSFLRNQKVSLRREMSELVQTEERYVNKLRELVNNIAADFRHKADSRGPGSSSPTAKGLARLFPPSLDSILQVNSQFLAKMMQIMDETESEASKDVQIDTELANGLRIGRTVASQFDGVGIQAFSNALTSWFPQFFQPYQDYMRASNEFPRFLADFMKNPGSSFTQRVQQTGEQRLKSMLIEPVQRLPRYSLYIDNMVNLLPGSHPAVQPLLRSRDIITDICSLDLSAVAEETRTVDRLKQLVSAWPTSLRFPGRITAAADFLELAPPYCDGQLVGDWGAGLFLIFTNHLILLRKKTNSTITSRGLLAEVERPNNAEMVTSFVAGGPGQSTAAELSFGGWIGLEDVWFAESLDRNTLWMTLSHGLAESTIQRERCSSNQGACIRAFSLQGPYEGKVGRWTEEVAKARIQGRFSEKEREGDSWAVRQISNSEGLNAYLAVFEEGVDDMTPTRGRPARLQIVVDKSKGTKVINVGHEGVEAVISISLDMEGLVIVETESIFGCISSDAVAPENLFHVLINRIGKLFQAQDQVDNPSLTHAVLSFNRKVLRSLTFSSGEDDSKPRAFRPPSPVKLLSSLLSSSGSLREKSNIVKSKGRVLKETPFITPPSNERLRTDSPTRPPATKPTNDLNIVGQSADSSHSTLQRLEETFGTYVLSMHTRKGNMVGRILRSRAAADELCVNEVYNALLEDPSRYQVVAENSVDVIVASFEKFLKIAWKEQMGPVIEMQTLSYIQDVSGTMLPQAFEQSFKATLLEMAPQNRRAFESLIKLLSDLLEASGNDGDRGALTITFAELLVDDGNAHQFVSLLDRLVEDFDSLFDSVNSMTTSGIVTPAFGSVSSSTKTRSINASSLSSNASSLRKRFGFGVLNRESSKADPDSKVGAILRTLGKATNSGNNAPNGLAGLSNASLARSKSDADSRPVTPKRPLSQDRPTVLGAFSFEKSTRPGSSQANTPLPSIVGSPNTTPGSIRPTLRKKRRSSLSDLTDLQQASRTAPSFSAIVPSSSDFPQSLINLSPRTPSPIKVPLYHQSYKVGSRKLKENSPSFTPSSLAERHNNIQSRDGVVITELRPSKRVHGTPSGIPTMKTGLEERQALNSPEYAQPKVVPGSPQKLRLQSPQKLRERLQSEQKAISDVGGDLQAEISKIGQEMSRISLGGSSRSGNELQELSDRVKKLETDVPAMIENLVTRCKATEDDLASSLKMTEGKVKKLDELYREANTENEMLYDRFNNELQKMMNAMKLGDREKELAQKLKEAQDEFLEYKKENVRLKRENLGLKAQIRAG